MAGPLGTFQIVDPFDFSTLLFDLNDDTGVNNAAYGSVKTIARQLKLRGPQRIVEYLDPETGDGGFTTFRKDVLTQTSWTSYFEASSYDNLRAGMGRLQQLLSMPGVIKLKETGSTDARYIRYEVPESLPSLLDQDEDTIRALSSFKYPGIDLYVMRQPYLLLDELTSSANKLTNATLLIDQGGTANRPDDWTWDSASNISAESIDVDEEAYEFTVATASARNLQQRTAAAAAAPGDIWTGSFYARSPDATAKCQVVVEFCSAANAVLATATGTLTTLTTIDQRLTVTTSAAPANTDNVLVSLRVDNDDATARIIRWSRVKLEEASAATPFIPGEETVGNDPVASGTTRGRAIPMVVVGDDRAEVQTYMKVGSSSSLGAVVLGAKSNDGIRGRYDILSWLNARRIWQAEDGTLGSGTSTVVDAEASPGSGSSAIEITGGTATSMLRRYRDTETTLIDGLRGTWDLYVRLKNTTAIRCDAQLRWGPSTLDPCPYEVGPEFYHDPSELGAAATTFDYVEKFAGRIVIPEESDVTLSGIALELWMRTNGTTRVDGITWVPADERALISVPGAGSELWLGKDLIGGATASFSPAGLASGAVRGGSYVLIPAATNQACGPTPVAGMVMPAGRHTFKFTVQEKPHGTAFAYDVRVRNITDASNTGKTLSRTTGTKGKAKTWEITIDLPAGSDSASDAYQPQVVVTTGTDAGQELVVKSIKHTVVPYLSANEYIRSRFTTSSGLVEHLDSSQALVSRLATQGAVPFRMEPGLHGVYIQPNDVPIAWYSEPRSVRSRTVVAGFRYRPRVYG